MSGQDAIRGFAVQTLICVLGALETGAKHWRSVTVEPDVAGDKVDILWEYDDEKLAQQVKSSKNQIGRAAVDLWCSELKNSNSADRYQLILAGPIAADVLAKSPFHGVEVPTPTSMDTLALIDQAITKLDRYLQTKALPSMPLSVREAIVGLVSARLIDGSIRAEKLTRETFDGWLQSWILMSYPAAVEQRLSANCDVLWSSLELAGPELLSNQSFDVVLPVSVVNAGPSVAVIEWFLLRVSCGDRKMLYVPDKILRVDTVAGEDLRTGAIPFSEFAVNPGHCEKVRVLCSAISRLGYDVDMWPEGEHKLELWVKFGALPNPRKVKTAVAQISIDHRSVLGTRHSRAIRFSSLDGFMYLI